MINRNFFCGGIALCCAMLLAACSSSRVSTMEETPTNAAHIISEQDNAIRSLRGYGTVSISSPALSNTASIDVSLRAPDSLRIKITGPFGITLGTVFATRSHYIAYDAWDNTVQRGTLDSNKFLPLPGFMLTFDDAFQFLKGLPPILRNAQKEADTSAAIEGEDADGRTVECIVGKGCIERARIKQPNGDDIVEFFSGYGDVNGISFPERISASAAHEGKMSIHYDDVNLNTQDLDFSISVPKDAKVVGAQ
ncbi:MAG TPA: DUF4292 domain-containing protein [Candidatus Kapabacteria bacterium]|nr:DUF4292 domain-containing protein [Candidatus Kapabacteria bacterium]